MKFLIQTRVTKASGHEGERYLLATRVHAMANVKRLIQASVIDLCFFLFLQIGQTMGKEMHEALKAALEQEQRVKEEA